MPDAPRWLDAGGEREQPRGRPVKQTRLGQSAAGLGGRREARRCQQLPW